MGEVKSSCSESFGGRTVELMRNFSLSCRVRLCFHPCPLATISRKSKILFIPVELTISNRQPSGLMGGMISVLHLMSEDWTWSRKLVVEEFGAVLTKEKSIFHTQFPKPGSCWLRTQCLSLALVMLSLALAGSRTLTSPSRLDVNGLLVLRSCVCCFLAVSLEPPIYEMTHYKEVC